LNKVIIAAAVTSLLGACSEMQTADSLPPIPVDNRFFAVPFNWDDGRSVTLNVAILNDKENFVVCTAAQGVRDGNDLRALGATNITLNGRTMIAGMQWARAYPGRGSIEGQLANCRRTNSPIVSNPDFDFSLSRTSFSASGRDS